MKKGQYVIARCSAAGVHAGTLESYEGQEVILTCSRRLWRWRAVTGITLSDVSASGILPHDSKIACEVREILLADMCELIPCTDVARDSIINAPVAAQQ